MMASGDEISSVKYFTHRNSGWKARWRVFLMGANSFELSLITGMSEAGAAVKGKFSWNERTMAWTLLWRA